VTWFKACACIVTAATIGQLGACARTLHLKPANALRIQAADGVLLQAVAGPIEASSFTSSALCISFLPGSWLPGFALALRSANGSLAARPAAAV
jgi:hypothetical protein